MRALALLLGLLTLAACSPRRTASYDAEYLLLEQIDSATMVETTRRGLRATRFEIDNDHRRTLFQHAASAFRFADVPSGPGASLQVAPMIDPRVWKRRSDGAGFEVRCLSSEGDWERLFELSINPAEKPEDRIWHQRQAPLELCSQPTTELELRTHCGPKTNCGADWTAWGNPKVVYPRSLKPRPERLVVLISIDTLRPDRLGLYGGPRPTSPNLDRMAADSVVFETAISSSPWTIPSHATLLTSTYPQVHGAGSKSPLPDSVPKLAEILQSAGWQTAGFVDTPFLNREFGFARGFDHYDDEEAPRGDSRRGARSTRQRLLHWLEEADERPAFIFWHLMDVHGPYGAPAPHGGKFRDATETETADPDERLRFLRRFGIHQYLRLQRYQSFDELLASYDEGIAFVDEVIGEVLDILRATGTYDDAVIAVTSDHGESFLDHDIWVGHGLFLTDDEIRVPLVLKLPGNRWAGRRVPEMVGQIDLAPTLLDAVDVDTPDSFQGRSLISPAPGEAGSLPEIVFGYSSNVRASFLRTSEYKYIGAAEADWKRVASVHLRTRLEVESTLQPLLDEQIYHLREDTAETESLAESTDPEKLQHLRDLLESHAAESAARQDGRPVEEPALSQEAREKLRALGYLD